ncbi:hypothetical protein NPIL_2511 [Nephila pilipes]|uniref:Uncharacterized protein n=1 Tax=Nephila pilipes TaxID=299642 RepID=A0A8X6QF97_NEPPI|nr:hypothetical protein NPIL_2511 [Nephila pilipes]
MDILEDSRTYVERWALGIKPDSKSEFIRTSCKNFLRFFNFSFCSERTLGDNLKIILESYGVDKYIPFLPTAIEMIIGVSGTSDIIRTFVKPCCYLLPQLIKFIT